MFKSLFTDTIKNNNFKNEFNKEQRYEFQYE